MRSIAQRFKKKLEERAAAAAKTPTKLSEQAFEEKLARGIAKRQEKLEEVRRLVKLEDYHVEKAKEARAALESEKKKGIYSKWLWHQTSAEWRKMKKQEKVVEANLKKQEKVEEIKEREQKQLENMKNKLAQRMQRAAEKSKIRAQVTKPVANSTTCCAKEKRLCEKQRNAAARRQALANQKQHMLRKHAKIVKERCEAHQWKKQLLCAMDEQRAALLELKERVVNEEQYDLTDLKTSSVSGLTDRSPTDSPFLMLNANTDGTVVSEKIVRGMKSEVSTVICASDLHRLMVSERLAQKVPEEVLAKKQCRQLEMKLEMAKLRRMNLSKTSSSSTTSKSTETSSSNTNSSYSSKVDMKLEKAAENRLALQQKKQECINRAKERRITASKAAALQLSKNK